MKTDTQLQQDILAELNWEPSINAAQIGVEVKDGIVTLAGHVSSYPEKWNAERAAQRVSGVKALTVEMVVTLPESNERTDADIAGWVESILHWSSFLPKDSIKVMVENGWVSLSGEVDWSYQKWAAIDAIRNLMGVTGVTDKIMIKPNVSSIVVKSDIEAALKRRAAADGAQHIVVKVEGDEVTLTGKVKSLSERDLAIHSAWCTPGVQYVKDNMTITC